MSVLTHLCKYTLGCLATVKAAPCEHQAFPLSPGGCCNFHYVETIQSTLEGQKGVLTGFPRRDNLLILPEVSEVSLPRHSIFHGITKNTWSPASVFHFKSLAGRREEKLNAQNSGRVIQCHGICFSPVSRDFSFPANTFKHFLFIWDESRCHILFFKHGDASSISRSEGSTAPAWRNQTVD